MTEEEKERGSAQGGGEGRRGRRGTSQGDREPRWLQRPVTFGRGPEVVGVEPASPETLLATLGRQTLPPAFSRARLFPALPLPPPAPPPPPPPPTAPPQGFLYFNLNDTLSWKQGSGPSLGLITVIPFPPFRITTTLP